MSSSVRYRGKGYDITGRKFGRLTALYVSGISKCWVETWRCRCDCGREVDVHKCHLLSGHTRSCGCLRTDNANRMNSKRHGNGITLGLQENTGKE